MDAEIVSIANTVGMPAESYDGWIDDALEADEVFALCMFARNPSVRVERVVELSHHDDPEVRTYAVGSGRLDATRRHEMSTDGSSQVRAELARTAAEDEVMVFMADVDAEVRTALCQSSECSVEVLRHLSDDTDDTVAEAARDAARGRGINLSEVDADPVDALAALLGGQQAEPTAAEITQMVAGDPKARREAARAAALAGADRAAVAADTSVVVRQTFARRDDLTDAEQDALLADTEVLVVAAYAVNPAADPARRDPLAGHADPRVRAAVARSTTDHAVQLQLAADVPEVHDQLALRLADLDLDVVVVLSHSPSRAVRKQVALQRTEDERLDGLWPSELVEWKVTAWKDRLAQLVQGEAYVKALELAPDYTAPLGSLAEVAEVLV